MSLPSGGLERLGRWGLGAFQRLGRGHLFLLLCPLQLILLRLGLAP